jgi:predicted trehalose synthase
VGRIATALADVHVTLRRRAEDPALYTTPSAVTGPTGRFSVDLYRLASEAAPTASGNLGMALVRERR